MNTAESFEVKKNIASDFNHVAVPNKMKSAAVKASIDAGGYTTTLVALEPSVSRHGMVPRTDVVRFRAATKAELREKILKEFPTAVFSLVDSDSIEKDLIRAARRAEVDAENARKAEVAAEEQLRSEVISEHRAMARSMSAEDQNKFTNLSLSSLQSDPASPWRAFLHDRPQFLAWPNNSFQNRTTLLQYCQQKGYWPVPTLSELNEAFKYCLSHGHFHQKDIYKRSDVDQKNAVRPFNRIENPAESISQQTINATIQALKQKFGVPFSCSVQKIESLGYSNEQAEQLFEAIRARMSATPVAGKNSEELKHDLQAMRNASGPRSRASIATGY